MVIPEIEVPGHAYAVMKSYPGLCCTGEPIRNSGHQKDLYCAGKELTFEFLHGVLSEVLDIFPSPYIHIGGDEAPKDRWRECPACQERIHREQLKNEEGLQAYLLQRCAEYFSFPVTPDKHFALERTSDLRKVYSAGMVPEDLPPEQRDAHLGGQCCVWTEHLTEDDIFSMLFPRVLAVAELIWRNPKKRNYDSFLAKVLDVEAYWNSMGIEYGPYSRNDTMPNNSI
jgi:hexosaminidase